MNSLFDHAWDEISPGSAVYLPANLFPEFLRLVEAQLMKIANLSVPPIANDPHITKRMNKFILEYQLQTGSFLLKQQVLTLLNDLLIDLKVIDWDSKNSYGNFEDNFQFYQEHQTNTVIEKGLGINVRSSSPSSLLLSDFEDEDIESIMDVVSSSPSIYEEDPINHYIRDSLFEIHKHHIKIKGKFLTSELLIRDLQEQNVIDFAALSDLQNKNLDNHIKIIKLKDELLNLHHLLHHSSINEGYGEGDNEYSKLLVQLLLPPFIIPKSDEFSNTLNEMDLKSEQYTNQSNLDLKFASTFLLICISLFFLIISYLLAI